MSKFFDSEYFFLVVVIALIAYSIYFMYSTIRYFMANVKARKKFLADHENDHAHKMNYYQIWAGVYLAFVTYCVYSFFTLNKNVSQYEWFRMAYFFVGIILLGQTFIAVVKRRIISSDKGFVYEDKQIAWRSVISMEPKRKGLQKKVDVLTSSEGTLEMPTDLGKAIHEEHEAYRQARKERKKEKRK